MSLFEEYEARTAYTKKQLPPMREMNDKERLEQLKARYEAMQYQKKIDDFGKPIVNIRYSAPTYAQRVAMHTQKNRLKSIRKEKLEKIGYGLTSAYKMTKQGVSKANESYKEYSPKIKERYKRINEVGGLKNKLHVLIKGSIYK